MFNLNFNFTSNKRVIVTEGPVNAERSCSGLGVVEGCEAELVIGAKEVRSEGTSEVKAKGPPGRQGAELVAKWERQEASAAGKRP